METMLGDAELHRRLTEEAQKFSIQLPAKLRALEPVQDAIREFRRKRVSYRLIAVLLKKHGLDVSHDTVYRFCRRVLKERPPGRPRSQNDRKLLTRTIRPAPERRTTAVSVVTNPRRGPRVADSKNL